MVEKLAQFYGDEICTIEGNTYFSFPTVDALAQEGVEEKLRKNGFGYRAKYISKTAKFISTKGSSEWLKNLQNLSYQEAKCTLMSLTGVGAKVVNSN